MGQVGNCDHFCLQIAGNNFAIGEGEVLRKVLLKIIIHEC